MPILAAASATLMFSADSTSPPIISPGWFGGSLTSPSSTKCSRSFFKISLALAVLLKINAIDAWSPPLKSDAPWTVDRDRMQVGRFERMAIKARQIQIEESFRLIERFQPAPAADLERR